MTINDVYINLKEIQKELDKIIPQDSIIEASNKLLALQSYGGLSVECIYEAKRILGKRQAAEWEIGKTKGYRGHELKHYLEGIMEYELGILMYAEKLNSMLINTTGVLRTIVTTLREEQNNNKSFKQS